MTTDSPSGYRRRMSEWIAEQRVVFVDARHGERTGRIAIGRPVVVSDREARCPISLEGLHHPLPDVRGGSPLQALLLAARLAGRLLHGFLETGGRVLDDDGDDMPLDAYFGPLLTSSSTSA